MLLKPLNVFVQITQLNSFAKAAKILGLSTSSISRIITKLEQELGFDLFERTTRSVYLTPAGTIFYEKAEEILSNFDLAKSHCANLENNLTGQVKIGAPASLAFLYISNCLHEFLTQYPHLNIKLINGDHLLDLLADDFDFVLHCHPLPDSQLHYRKLGTWTRILCAAPDYLAKHGEPKQISQLTAHNCLLHQANKAQAWPLVVDDQVQSVAVTGSISTDSQLNIKNLALKSVGIAYLPSFIIFRELLNGSLVKILPDAYLPTQAIYAVYTKNKYRIKKVRALLDFLTLKIQQQQTHTVKNNN